MEYSWSKLRRWWIRGNEPQIVSHGGVEGEILEYWNKST